MTYDQRGETNSLLVMICLE